MRKFRLVGLGRPLQQQEVAGQHETAASLLAAGLDSRTSEFASATPLQRAAAEGHVDIVHQLVKHGADVNHQDAVHGNSALHEAAWRGYSQTALILCRQRANVNAVNRAGFTPLHLCCQNGHNETCRVLLIANASPNAKNHYGDTPMHTSARYGHAGVMRILISANCNVSEQNKNGDTALHIAAAMGRRKLTRILLSAGCSPHVKNKQGELASDIARRKEFSEIAAMLLRPPAEKVRSKSKSRTAKREKADSGASSSKNSGSREDSKHKSERKRRKEKHSSRPQHELSVGPTSNGHVVASPYGCHANPELAKKLHPKLSTLPNEPLRQGEQYYLDLAGNIQKGPVGVQTCYCGPVLHRLECRLAKDKQDILQRLDSAHLRLDARIDGLERKTQLQLQGLQRTVDSLGLESSAAGLQRVRNSIVLADPGHTTPPLPSLDLASNSTTSHSRIGSDVSEQRAKPAKTNQQPNEVQYTLDKLGLDSSPGKQLGLQALRNRLSQTRLREQRELEAIVEQYERRNPPHTNGNGTNGAANAEDQSESESEDEEMSAGVLPPPILSSQKPSNMLSDSRYENYDYPPAIVKPLSSYLTAPQQQQQQQQQQTNGGLTNGISYRNLPLPRYHLDPVMENGTITTAEHGSENGNASRLVESTAVVHGFGLRPHFSSSGHDLRYHDDRDRHNDSGYSTRPGESSQGPSPSLSGPAESMEGDPVIMSPRTARRSELFQSHFARDLAQTLPTHSAGNNSNGYGQSNGVVGGGVVAYPRVRFAIPNDHDALYPPGTISSSSLV